jgi:hypothetical protein
MNARMYSPVMGRFLSPDPIVADPENSQAYNRYAYVWNNPLSLVDPSGLSPENEDEEEMPEESEESEASDEAPVEQASGAQDQQAAGHGGGTDAQGDADGGTTTEVRTVELRRNLPERKPGTRNTRADAVNRRNDGVRGRVDVEITRDPKRESVTVDDVEGTLNLVGPLDDVPVIGEFLTAPDFAVGLGISNEYSVDTFSTANFDNQTLGVQVDLTLTTTITAGFDVGGVGVTFFLYSTTRSVASASFILKP